MIPETTLGVWISRILDHLLGFACFLVRARALNGQTKKMSPAVSDSFIYEICEHRTVERSAVECLVSSPISDLNPKQTQSKDFMKRK